MRNFHLLIILVNVGFLHSSTWELYQVFSGKNHSAKTSTHRTSKVPLVFTYKKEGIGDLTTAKGRTLYVSKRHEKKAAPDIPRFTSKPNVATDSGSTSAFSEFVLAHVPHSRVVNTILKYVTVDQAMDYLGALRKKLTNVSGTLNPFLLHKSTSISSRGEAGLGGIAFPSLEGALLSLAFLTFAVFLIDLIQTLLSRLRVGTPFTSVTGGATITGGTTGLTGRASPSIPSSSLTNQVWSAIERGLLMNSNFEGTKSSLD